MLVHGQGCRSALEAYLAEDLRHGWGGDGFIDAAIGELQDEADKRARAAPPSAVDLVAFKGMLRVAEHLRGG